MEPRAWFLPAGAGNVWAGRWRPRTKTGKRKRKRKWRSSRRFSRWNLQASARSKKAGTDRVRQCIHQGDSYRSPVTPAIMRMHPSALALGDSFGLLVSGLWRHSPCMVQQEIISQHHGYVETKDSTVHPCLGSWPSVLKKALYHHVKNPFLTHLLILKKSALTRSHAILPQATDGAVAEGVREASVGIRKAWRGMFMAARQSLDNTR